MTTTGRRWTGARRRALSVFASFPLVRESNHTSEAAGLVYWQTADWLRREGFIERVDPWHLRLTKAGAHRLAEIQAQP